MTHNPHDHLAKEVFSRSAEARSLFRAFLPEEHLLAIDLNSLRSLPGSFVDERLKGQHSDLLFTVRTRDAPLLVYLLFEHKSHPDRWLPLQLLTYVARIWSRYRNEHGDRCRLPMILPFVLYHGECRWNEPLTLLDLCHKGGQAHKRLAPAQASLPFTLIDLSQVTENSLLRTLSRGTATTTLTMLLMKSIRATGLLYQFRSWAPLIRRTRAESGGRQMLELLVYYLVAAAREEIDVDELEVVLSDVVGPESKELVMNTGDKLIQKGEEIGMRKGLEQGLERGLEQGMREALSSILRTRFGETSQEARSRMDTADLETLQQWLARAVSAKSVSGVFENPENRT